MAMTKVRALDGGGAVVRVTGDGREYVLREGQFEDIAARPVEEQADAVYAAVAANMDVDPAQVRTEADELARETAANATTGEAHQDAGRE